MRNASPRRALGSFGCRPFFVGFENGWNHNTDAPLLVRLIRAIRWGQTARRKPGSAAGARSPERRRPARQQTCPESSANTAKPVPASTGRPGKLTVLSTPAAVQARRNAAQRLAFLAEQPLLSTADVPFIALIDTEGHVVYPAWQFEPDGSPNRTVAAAVSTLRGAGFSDWAIALWFTSPTGLLDDQSPRSLLDTEPQAVAAAALQSATDFPA
jgi:hypothetical protein